VSTGDVGFELGSGVLVGLFGETAGVVSKGVAVWASSSISKPEVERLEDGHVNGVISAVVFFE
jgi:hypothetical protein